MTNTLMSFRAQVGEIRTATYKGQEHIIIPVVALVEGVMQPVNAPSPELVTKDVFAHSVNGWNGRPVTVNHPRVNGELVSANAPTVLETEQVGMIFSSEIKNDKLVMEAWINTARVTELSETHQATVARVASGEVVEVSVGAFVDVMESKGEHNGTHYDARWVNVVPDHLAILEEGLVGACSVENGCGVNRAAQRSACGPGCACQTKESDKSFRERILTAIRAAPQQVGNALGLAYFNRLTTAELSDRDKRIALERGLEEHLKDDWVFVIAVFSEYVVYEHSGRLYKQNYTISNDRVSGFEGDPVEVTPKTDFIAVNTPTVTANEDGSMNKKERIAGLISNDKTRFAETDAEWLESLDEDQLEKLAPTEEEPKKVASSDDGDGEDEDEDKAKPPVVAQSAEEYLNQMPTEMRSVFSQGLKLQREQRTHYVKVLNENPRNAFAKEELEGMSIEQLERMARLADVPDYSARPAATHRAAEEDDPYAAPTPPKVFEVKKAADAA